MYEEVEFAKDHTTSNSRTPVQNSLLSDSNIQAFNSMGILNATLSFTVIDRPNSKPYSL